jgi:hypothetical protein
MMGLLNAPSRFRLGRGRGTIPPIAALLLALSVASCDKILSEPERDSDDVPPSEILSLTRTGGDLPLRADGVTRDTLEARIPEGSTARTVIFTTSRGSFLLSPVKQELKVRAEPSGNDNDGRLIARAVLVADTIPGQAVVSASIGDFTQYLFVPFVK